MRGFAAGLLVSLSCAALGQSPAPAFEVASVRPADPAKSPFYVPMETGPERFSAFGFTLDYLIQWSYGLRDFQVSGEPVWLKTEKFDIQAKAEAPAGLDQIKRMVQTLLADRFQLKLHRESKELSVYALIVGKAGPKLQPAKDPVPAGSRGRMEIFRGSFTSRGATMGLLAEALSTMLDRPVLDQTGLSGNYDIKLSYDQSTVRQEVVDLGAEPTDGQSMFSAIQDVGLKLDPQKLPVAILVIDSVQHPSEN
jgi:uncharacterized protein (TIGR03435 family)